MRFEYSVIRYVPDVGRGEFVNAAVIVVGQGGAAMRAALSPKRVGHLRDGKAHVRTAGKYLSAVGKQIDEMASNPSLSDPEWLHELVVRNRQLVQLTEPTPIVGDDADSLADILAAELLTPIEHRHRGITRTRARAALGEELRSLRDELEELDEDVTLFESVDVVAGDDQTIRMDFAIRNGEVRQLSHAFAFASKTDQVRRQVNRDVKAWAWVVDNLRESGGQLKLKNGQRLELNSGLDIGVYVVPPESGSDEMFEQSLHTFDQLEIPVAEQPEEIAERARELLEHA